ncbi:ribonuclease HII [Lacrimispora sp. 210928-DFI.3.58]|uniref:ribonuclease HII n=1 Tax=Lacrimispora sp. 210928-DFI.3.58 TaxID=2883214 RepID=UPI001D076B2E|nr:ribonuclease HII [Lacrimispora sp. 210928-DFI.3.58]MCB7318266.1 ribonuclease HII [Lacrimispora sp. 210928-DFI.3.58]
MIKLNILNMERFLETVNGCTGRVNMLCPDGRKQNINKRYWIQDQLRARSAENHDSLRLTLEIPGAEDYMKIVYYYVGEY